jgi:hypothetical protein
MPEMQDWVVAVTIVLVPSFIALWFGIRSTEHRRCTKDVSSMIDWPATREAGEFVRRPYVYTRNEMYLDLFVDWCLCRDTEALRKEAQEVNK